MQHFPTVCDPSLVKNEIMQAPLTLDKQTPCTVLMIGKTANFGQCLDLNKPSYIQVDVI